MSLLGQIFKSKPKSIFVQIASYRDPELIPTIENLLSNASNPDDLRICIANQYHEEDKFNDLSKYENDSRFEILNIPYDKSKGVCWARNLLNSYYKNEKYTLQLDSHHRFISNWDVELVKMLEELINSGYKKPLLTAYVPSYDPNNDPEDRKIVPWKLNFDKFSPDGPVLTLPGYINNYKELSKPLRTQFFSGHFVFTLGKFCTEVPYDPNLYFHGEEITMAARSFTNGYDMFSPHKVILWHEYTREGRIKHWDDDPEWTSKNNFSFDRVKKVLGIDGKVCTPCMMKNLGVFYLGKERSKREYEEFAGLHFESRSATQYTLDHKEPPGPVIKNYDKHFYNQIPWGILFHRELLEGHLEFDFWAIILLDENGVELHRQDIDSSTVDLILSDKNEVLNINGQYYGKPYKRWVVWPHKDEWLMKIEGIKA